MWPNSGGDSEFNGLYIVVALKKLCKSAVYKMLFLNPASKLPFNCATTLTSQTWLWEQCATKLHVCLLGCRFPLSILFFSIKTQNRKLWRSNSLPQNSGPKTEKTRSLSQSKHGTENQEETLSSSKLRAENQERNTLFFKTQTQKPRRIALPSTTH